MPDYPQTQEQKSKPQKRAPRQKGIFRRELVREFAGMGLLVFSILLGIVVLSQLIRLLGEAVGGALAAEGVPALMGFAALNYLPVLLSLSLFLSVLLALSRSYRDSEMVVWFSSGIGLTRWIAPVLWYALPVVAVIALLSLVLSPWALTKAEEFKQRLNSRDDVTAATPGVFRESGSGDRVYFIEKIEEGQKRINNIFVQSVQHGKMGTVAAKEGMQEIAPNGDRFLILLNGTRYEGVPGQADYRVVQFERYAMRIETEEARRPAAKLQSLSTLELLDKPDSWNISELEWRLSLPLSALILALLAIPLSFVNPRAGRSFNLIAALVIYMIYNNSISVSNSWVAQQKIGAVTGFVALHGLMMAVAVVLFYQRLSVYSWKRLLR
jgi:lipopolysaccharide export system permease protein